MVVWVFAAAVLHDAPSAAEDGRAGPAQARRLTFDGIVKRHPAWSPDGRVLALTHSRAHRFHLVRMAADGTGLTPLTLPEGDPAFEPAWSPGGSQIAFVHDALAGTDGQLRIHVMNADGSDAHQVVEPAQRPSQDEHPAWSPDGSRLAFTSTRDGNAELYLCDLAADGRLRRLTNDSSVDSHPSWSPNGSQLTFCSSRFGNMEICLMAADGSGVRRLTDHASLDYQPRWSPDGKWIAFTGTRSGNYDVYLVRPDGSGLHNLTRHPALDKDPAWTPDSQRITFVSVRDGRSDLYTSDIDLP
jgi:Tol biopolymer transport system component